MKVFVQGDREAREISFLARRLTWQLKKAGIKVNLGAYGELVKIFIEAGCVAHCHGHRKDRGNCPLEVDYFNCHQAALDVCRAAHLPEETLLPVAWGIRLGLLLNSDAFVFFPGREGTLAHLFPVLAFSAKRQTKPVALIGWPEEIWNPKVQKFIFPPDGRLPKWFRHFSADEIDQVVPFLSQTFS